MTNGCLDVYISDFATHLIPSDIMQEARRINNGKRLGDRRTKGERYLKAWARKEDVKLIESEKGK